MEKIVHQIAAALLARGQTLATAESCTGGLVGAALTGLPGSSAWYLGGIVAYSNSLKTRLLGVTPETLKRHGAVSSATAKAMAAGARKKCKADFAVSITGIAGPGGGTPHKPVGLVFMAMAGPDGRIGGWEYHFTGRRANIRAQAVKTVLQRLLDALR